MASNARHEHSAIASEQQGGPIPLVRRNGRNGPDPVAACPAGIEGDVTPTRSVHSPAVGLQRMQSCEPVQCNTTNLEFGGVSNVSFGKCLIKQPFPSKHVNFGTCILGQIYNYATISNKRVTLKTTFTSDNGEYRRRTPTLESHLY